MGVSKRWIQGVAVTVILATTSFANADCQSTIGEEGVNAAGYAFPLDGIPGEIIAVLKNRYQADKTTKAPNADALSMAKSSEKIVYCEEYYTASEVDKRVEYYAPGGKLIVEKQLNYSTGKTSPQYDQKDHRNDEIRRVRLEGGEWHALYQKPSGDRKSEVFDKDAIDVLDAGFDNAVREKWEQLMASEAIKMDFFSSVHMRPVTLQVDRQALEECGVSEDWSGVVCLKVYVDNWIIRLFAGKLSLLYDTETRKLLIFNGVANVLDNDGEDQKLSIVYFYSS